VSEPLIDWAWVGEHLGEIGSLTVDHVILTVIAVAIGLAIAFPLGVFAHRHRRSYGPIVSLAGILYTIPSLALFALLVPFTGLTKVTAEIGLVSYTLLILIRNIVVGLDGVPADARETAIGMGFTGRQLLWRVELPLALPAVMAGVRIATVTTIGLVTVTAVITEGGLGQLILEAIQRGELDFTKAFVGSAVSLALAVAADLGLLGTQRLLTPWARGRTVATP
jgi:osmoprotectant transport system permease protein